MKQWQLFEKECESYLNKKFGNNNIKYVAKGSFNSTLSDIEVNSNGELLYYIESKMPKSQCGQFVLLKDDNKQFYFSENNKISINEYSKEIIKYINNNNLGLIDKKTIDIAISEELIVNYIIAHYKNKNVRYIITRIKEDYYLIPLIFEELINHFKFKAKLRIKKSGSRKVPRIMENDIILILNKKFESNCELIKKEDNLLFKINTIEKDFFINVNGYDIMFKRDSENIYQARILSNTKNYCVIFSLELIENKNRNI